MTRDELDELDAQLDAETISEEEYCDTLRSEVSRLHPDYDDCDVQNMVRMQLRVMALETMLSEDNNAARVVERGPVPRGWDAGGDESGEDRPIGGTESQPGEGGEGSGEAAAGQEQSQGERAQAQTEPGQEGKGSPENGQGEVPGGSPSEGGKGDKDQSQGGGGKDQKDKGNGGKDQKDKGKGGGGGSGWWTWQIVPESLTVGQQEPEPEPELESEQERGGDDPTGSAEAEPRPKDEPEGDVIDAEFEEIKD